jgi:hypothetical protein
MQATNFRDLTLQNSQGNYKDERDYKRLTYIYQCPQIDDPA